MKGSIKLAAWALIGAAIAVCVVAILFVLFEVIPSDSTTVLCFAALGVPLGLQFTIGLLTLERLRREERQKPQ